MSQQIIMNFSLPPSADDIQVIAQDHLENLPEELAEFCDDLVIQIEELPDEATESDLELSDPFELLSLFKSSKELSPGIEKQGANDNDILILYRRPILDMWCETGEHLSIIVREAMIGELGNNFDFSEDEIEEMNQRHHQGML